jgi:hypothetical protein
MQANRRVGENTETRVSPIADAARVELPRRICRSHFHNQTTPPYPVRTRACHSSIVTTSPSAGKTSASPNMPAPEFRYSTTFPPSFVGEGPSNSMRSPEKPTARQQLTAPPKLGVRTLVRHLTGREKGKQYTGVSGFGAVLARVRKFNLPKSGELSVVHSHATSANRAGELRPGKHPRPMPRSIPSHVDHIETCVGYARSLRRFAR